VTASLIEWSGILPPSWTGSGYRVVDIMRRAGWLGVGLIVTIVLAGAVTVVPATATNVSSLLESSAVASSASTYQPVWNSGNLCNSIHTGPGPGDISCRSTISNSQYPLWYNFSAGGNPGAVVNVTIYGSNDCINMNFRGVYEGVINIVLYGTDYSCSSYSGNWNGNAASPALWSHGGQGGSGCSHGSGHWDGSQAAVDGGRGGVQKKCAPGVNIAVNSEKDTLNLVQSPRTSRCHHNGGDYSTNVTVYSRQTFVNATQSPGSQDLNTTVTYIGITAGFGTCPSGITDGRVTWNEVSYGSRNTFSTIFVDGTNVAHLPPNYAYSTEPLGPPDGTSFGWGNLYGNETTTTAPPGSCHYLEP